MGKTVTRVILIISLFIEFLISIIYFYTFFADLAATSTHLFDDLRTAIILFVLGLKDVGLLSYLQTVDKNENEIESIQNEIKLINKTVNSCVRKNEQKKDLEFSEKNNNTVKLSLDEIKKSNYFTNTIQGLFFDLKISNDETFLTITDLLSKELKQFKIKDIDSVRINIFSKDSGFIILDIEGQTQKIAFKGEELVKKAELFCDYLGILIKKE